jgi:hypothetical protein
MEKDIIVDEGSDGMEGGVRSQKKRLLPHWDSDDKDLMDENNIPVVWKSLKPLLDPEQANKEKLSLLVDKWFACIYTSPVVKSKRKAATPQFIFGPATASLFSMENGHYTLQINSCRPYDLESKLNVVEEYVKPDSDIWNFKVSDVIAGPLEVTFIDNKQWEIKSDGGRSAG